MHTNYLAESPIKKERSSNIELYRIVMMFLIVVHHYFVNSGLISVADTSPISFKSIFLYFWGMWGHIGTNGFVLITGYFMCRSSISIKKFLKLFLQIEFYNISIFLFFVLIGEEHFSIELMIRELFPIHEVNTNFVDCYLLFFLFIPFLNILINNMSRFIHLLLISLFLAIYTIIAKVPGINVNLNYVTWFIVIYLIGAYIRHYSIPYKDSLRFWIIASITSILISWLSILFFLFMKSKGFNYSAYHLLMAANAPLALLVGVCTFMTFKNIKLRIVKIINKIGGGDIWCPTNSCQFRNYAPLAVA